MGMAPNVHPGLINRRFIFMGVFPSKSDKSPLQPGTPPYGVLIRGQHHKPIQRVVSLKAFGFMPHIPYFSNQQEVELEAGTS